MSKEGDILGKAVDMLFEISSSLDGRVTDLEEGFERLGQTVERHDESIGTLKKEVTALKRVRIPVSFSDVLAEVDMEYSKLRQKIDEDPGNRSKCVELWNLDQGLREKQWGAISGQKKQELIEWTRERKLARATE